MALITRGRPIGIDPFFEKRYRQQSIVRKSDALRGKNWITYKNNLLCRPVFGRIFIKTTVVRTSQQILASALICGDAFFSLVLGGHDCPEVTEDTKTTHIMEDRPGDRHGWGFSEEWGLLSGGV